MNFYSKYNRVIKMLLSVILVSSSLGPISPRLTLAQSATSLDQNFQHLRKSEWPKNMDNEQSESVDSEGDPEVLSPPPSIKPATDSIIVKFKDGNTPDSFASTYGFTSIKTIPGLNALVAKLPEGADLKSILSTLKSDPKVQYAEPDNVIYNHEPTSSDVSVTNATYAINPLNNCLSNEPHHSISQCTTVTSDVYSGLNTPHLPDSTSNQSSYPYAKAGSVPERFVPNDPYFPQQIGMDDPINDLDINAPEAWGDPTLLKDQVVAIISDGVDTNHPDLIPSIWSNEAESEDNGIDDDGNSFIDDVHGWNFVDNDNNVNKLSDPPIRGTQIAGTLAAAMANGIGIAGIATNAKILPVKTFSSTTYSGSYSQIAAGIAYAEKAGATIAILDFISTEPSAVILDALKSSSMLFIASPGFGKSNIDFTPVYPASYNLPNLLIVGGAEKSKRSSDIITVTNYGRKTVHVAAPIDNDFSTVYSVKPAYAAQIDTGTYRAIFNGMGFEFLPSYKQIEYFQKALDYLTEGKTTPKVLLVQDDHSTGGTEWEEDFLEAYKSLLHESGYVMPDEEGSNNPPKGEFEVVTVPMGESGPSKESMESYDAVIWFTGLATNGTFLEDPTTAPVLTEADRTNLTNYLNTGGSLLLTGPTSLYGSEHSSFVTDTLHLDYLYTGPNVAKYELLGVSGSIYDGLSSWSDGYGAGRVIISAHDAMAVPNLILDSDEYDTPENLDTVILAYGAGVGARILGAFPDYKPEMVIKRIVTSAKKFPGLKSRTMSGGMLDAYRALAIKDIPGNTLNTSEVSDFISLTSDPVTSDPSRVYSVELHAGEMVEATLTGDEGTDFDLYLYDPSATTVESSVGIVASSEEKDTSSEHFIYTVQQSGTYYLNVVAFKGSGNFTLGLNYSARGGTYEDSSDRIEFSGDWNTVSDSKYSGGSMKRLNNKGYTQFTFYGSYMKWIGTKGQDQGIANFYLDGQLVKSISLYSDIEQEKQNLFELEFPADRHTIKIEWTGKVDPKAKKNQGANINVDALVVKNLIQDANKYNAQLRGSWLTLLGPLYYGNSMSTSNHEGSYAEFNFTGSKVSLIAPVGTNRGIADIYIDGEYVKSVDLYRNKRYTKSVVFTSPLLEGKQHTIRIVNSGKKNEASTSPIIAIDAIEIE